MANHWSVHFEDTTHKVFSIGKYFVKMLPGSQKSALRKEYLIQKILSDTSYVPKPIACATSKDTILPGFVIEEKIEFARINLDRANLIAETARALHELHSYSQKKRDLILKLIPMDKYLDNGTYSPINILNGFILKPYFDLKIQKSKLINSITNKTIKEINKTINLLARKITYKKDYCAFIHGDLNDTNIVVTAKGNICVLDWADGRWDISSCDIAQFFYLYNLTDKEKKDFLKIYSCNWLNEDILEIHRLLLVGWDLIYLLTIDLEIPDDKMRLLPLKNKVWKEKVLPL